MTRRTDIVKMYGPYTRKADKRKHFVLIYANGQKGSLSYPKWVMENHLGRLLEDWETVDHIDNDETNDEISNLQILSLKDNILKQHQLTPAIYQDYFCPNCNEKFKFYLKDAERLKRKNQAGPFCSKKCAGKYGTSIQYADRIAPNLILDIEY